MHVYICKYTHLYVHEERVLIVKCGWSAMPSRGVDRSIVPPISFSPAQSFFRRSVVGQLLSAQVSWCRRYKLGSGTSMDLFKGSLLFIKECTPLLFWDGDVRRGVHSWFFLSSISPGGRCSVCTMDPRCQRRDWWEWWLVAFGLHPKGYEPPQLPWSVSTSPIALLDSSPWSG
jgi:hypothetical protein